ncbi:MAG: helix-turn-helix transcriptional regulator [Bacteroidaceae bacterium]|nr:helix-turn-helix transcriptional regulator [Bacteroidaceae bacterium]MBQ9190131.1 helix-turn-helix transcriptional regulator [Bacteroidaceae bacterium]
MYNLKEAWVLMHGELPFKNWDGRMYCNETDASITFRANETHGYMAAYTFTLVLEGWLTIIYSGQQLTLRPNDLYIYSPGLPVTVVEASEDYHAICLLADEHISIELPTVRDMVHIAYLPIVRVHEPKLTLTDEDAKQLASKMREITAYLHSDHIFKEKVLQMLYAIFLLDLQNAQDRTIALRSVPQRVEEIFINFIRLLPDHFAAHHDIAFYASALNISPVYLSRVVRQVSGRTVIDYVNQHLLMEASFLLKTSKLSIAQIADRLHFADQASFCKFFTRMKGCSPKAYRQG